MAENDPKLNPEAPSGSDEGSISVAPYSRSFPLLELLRAGIELGPELPRAIPITTSKDDIRHLTGLLFNSATEAEDFADGLAEFCYCDGERLFLKKPAAINRDFSGVN